MENMSGQNEKGMESMADKLSDAPKDDPRDLIDRPVTRQVFQEVVDRLRQLETQAAFRDMREHQVTDAIHRLEHLQQSQR